MSGDDDGEDSILLALQSRRANLEEHEWEQVLPLLRSSALEIMRDRREHDVPLSEAKDAVYGRAAFERYFEITGVRETELKALWHHRLNRLGPPCRVCGKPLRTPRAKFCAACGAPR
jgi:hypothetical protein